MAKGTAIAKTKKTALAKNRPFDEHLTDKIETLRTTGKLATIAADEDRLDVMVAEILEAEDDERILGGTTPIVQLVDTVISIEAVNFLPSSFRSHDYAVFSWRAADGRSGVCTNGGPRLVAQLARAVELDKVPGWVVKVSSATVEYEPGHTGDTYFFTRPQSK